jgi:hypothetical protein
MSPTVLLACGLGSPTDVERVQALADRLRRDGIVVLLDHHADDPLDDWGEWQRRHASIERDRVLLVCPSARREQVESEYNARKDWWEDHGDLLLISFEEGTEKDVESALPLVTRFRLPEDYERLYFRITHPLGALPFAFATGRIGESWRAQIEAAQSAGDLEVQDSTDRIWPLAPLADIGLDDHLWDTGSAVALDVLARRIPVTTRGSTIIAKGRVHYKQRPIPRCPDCDGVLQPAIVSVRFALAPDPTAVQRIPGYHCACGSQWPDPFSMRSAHEAAFGPTDPPAQ